MLCKLLYRRSSNNNTSVDRSLVHCLSCHHHFITLSLLSIATLGLHQWHSLVNSPSVNGIEQALLVCLLCSSSSLSQCSTASSSRPNAKRRWLWLLRVVAVAARGGGGCCGGGRSGSSGGGVGEVRRRRWRRDVATRRWRWRSQMD